MTWGATDDPSSSIDHVKDQEGDLGQVRGASTRGPEADRGGMEGGDIEGEEWGDLTRESGDGSDVRTLSCLVRFGRGAERGERILAKATTKGIACAEVEGVRAPGRTPDTLASRSMGSLTRTKYDLKILHK